MKILKIAQSFANRHLTIDMLRSAFVNYTELAEEIKNYDEAKGLAEDLRQISGDFKIAIDKIKDNNDSKKK